MRIGLLAPISHPIPPPGYGPWERVAYEEAEGLVELGHEVTLFAPEGTKTSAKLFATVPHSLDQAGVDARTTEEAHIFTAVDRAIEGGIDVLHSHLHVHVLGFARHLPVPLITTLHGVAWDPATHPLLRRYASERFVSISNSERQMLPELNYIATVYNGLNFTDHPINLERAEHLLFAGRIAPEKAPDLAIALAEATGRPLRIAGSIEERYRDFFEAEVAPHLGGGIEYLGPMGRLELAAELSLAAALVMPLRWPEPFGLVVIEAMATGTPVIAWRQGAMPEVVGPEAGFLVDDLSGAKVALSRIDQIDPEAAGAYVRRRFSRSAMARGYLQAFEAEISR